MLFQVVLLCLLSTSIKALAYHTAHSVNLKSVHFFHQFSGSDFLGGQLKYSVVSNANHYSGNYTISGHSSCMSPKLEMSVMYLTHLLLQYHHEGLNTLPADLGWSKSCTDIHLTPPSSNLYHCVTLDIPVDILHNSDLCPSLCDNQFDMCVESILDLLPETLIHEMHDTAYMLFVIRSVFLLLACYLHLLLANDFNMFSCLLYHNLIIHAVLIHHIPHEDSHRRAFLSLLLIKCSM